MRPYILSESNWKSVKQEKTEVAVLTWGATEAHNYHLPYGTDNYQIEAIAAEAGKIASKKGAKLKVLPNIPFGVNTGQADIKLDMNLNPSTQFAILSDIIEVLNRQGIYKLILLNGHGGNNFKPILRELGLKYPKMLLVTSNFFDVVDKSQFFEEEGDHADEMETSLMLYLKPELVSDLKEAGNGKENKSRITGIREGWAWAERQWSMVTEDTGIGNPRKATKEKGEGFFKAVTEKLANLIMEISEVDIKNRYE
ncbi:creatininase family protein [Christiangramia echinicola]|uniref:Creatinine amidohydrolase n=1 Tax=Christiangramia echinicola TaxID=279359 RepID=A0A1H1MXB3_9FLAO|nr:creatininase family protein [Christiangramia echinicola]SDR91531.1 creatinine amidohydrolase [Christiangramia echinicola]